MTDAFVIGDLHGYFEQYVALLRSEDLVSADLEWRGGNTNLWLIGDLFDRGPAGLDCLDLTMELQQQAAAAGGRVNCLLGNHELMLLCAHRFGNQKTSAGMSVIDQWLMWGGNGPDLAGLGAHHAAWLARLPAMAHVGDKLLIHADSTFYVDCGATVAAVNSFFEDLMQSDDLLRWELTLNRFTEHQGFSRLPVTGARHATMMLRLFGGGQLVHGHTPIPIATQIDPRYVTEPIVYCGGKCVNVDGCFYLGSDGFVFRFEID